LPAAERPRTEGAPTPLIEASAVHKRFDGGRVHALRGLDLTVYAGEVVAITGPSGCGKSTLLQLLGALDLPCEGELRFNGIPIADVSDLADFRAREIGFIFQSFHLIPTLTALENVQVPMLGIVRSGHRRHQRATELLEAVGLDERAHQLPATLSGGERQRVAVARSLANSPRLMLADEPTGNLDSVNAQRILDLLFEIHARFDTTLIIVTHDPKVAARADRVVRMLDGCTEAISA
jgi:ABC-type lipoprotein export system ATPase subunit